MWAATLGAGAAVETQPPIAAIAMNSCGTARVSLLSDINSATARPGDTFKFSVLDPIEVSRSYMLPANASGIGVVSLAEHAGRNGKGGFISLDPRFIKLPDGRDVHVMIDRSAPSMSPTGKSNNIPGAVGIIPGVGIVLGAYGFLHHGSDITIPAGTSFRVFVGDEETVSHCRTSK